MPFVRRTIPAVSESTFSQIGHVTELHVKASKVQKGDTVIPFDEIPDATLADLAKSYPREYGAAARDRGLQELEEDDEELPTEGDDDDDDEDDEEEHWTPAQEKFLAAPAKEAVELVNAAATAQNVELLAQYAEAEEAKDKPRKSVLEAIAKAIGE